MKKGIAILIAVILLLGMAACGGGGGTETSPPAESPSPTAPGTDTPPPSPTEPATPPVVDENFEIPYVDFGYEPTSDPFARETYQFAHIIMMHSPFTQLMVDMYALMGTRLNYEISSYSSNRDADLFMNLIETNAGQGANGMVIEGDFTLQDRIFEITDELDVVFMPGLSPFITEQGQYLRPSAVMDSYKMGWDCMDFMIDNYERYTGKAFDAEKIGIMTIQFAIITDFNTRQQGAYDAYAARYPDLVGTHFFDLDTSPEPNPMAAEAGYNYAASIIAANPEFDGWLMFGVAEDFADGASRALEDMGLGETSLATCVAVTMLTERWKAGYEGCWVAGADTPPIQWAHAIISGLMQLLDGQATPETLWPQYRDPGQDYTVIKLPFTLVERDIFKAYDEAVARYEADVFTG